MLRQIYFSKRVQAQGINQLVLPLCLHSLREKSVVAYEKPHKIVDMVFRQTQVKK